MNGRTVFNAMREVAGVTTIDTKDELVMVRLVVPDTPDMVAVMVVEPDVSALAKTAELMVAVTALLEDLIMLADRFFFEPSEKIPVAVSCSVRPADTLGAADVTEIKFKVAMKKLMICPHRRTPSAGKTARQTLQQSVR